MLSSVRVRSTEAMTLPSGRADSGYVYWVGFGISAVESDLLAVDLEVDLALLEVDLDLFEVDSDLLEVEQTSWRWTHCSKQEKMDVFKARESSFDDLMSLFAEQCLLSSGVGVGKIWKGGC